MSLSILNNRARLRRRPDWRGAMTMTGLSDFGPRQDFFGTGASVWTTGRWRYF